MPCPTQETLDSLFPSTRADDFFEAIYGGAEDGAYDIRLTCQDADEHTARLSFELLRRPGQCLRCSLTYGLPQVFQRHPVIDIANLAMQLAKAMGWEGPVNWALGSTQEISADLHIIPLTLEQI